MDDWSENRRPRRGAAISTRRWDDLLKLFRMNMRAAKVTLLSETEVTNTRTFDAPAHLVWRAYTEPDLLKRWMLGPPGWSMPVCEVELQVGAGYRWRWRNVESGREFGFHGVFLRIEPDAEIMHTLKWTPFVRQPEPRLKV
jgi:uncharacterized protein YndB with AHSA1/START domain